MDIKPGTALKAITLEVRQWVTKPAAIPSPPGVPLYSYAPIFDQATGKGSVELVECSSATPGAPPTPGGSGVTPPPPVTDNSPNSGAEKLALKVKAPKIKAKTVNQKKNRRKGLKFKLTGNATRLKAVLKTGTNPLKGKVVAAGKLSKVKRKGTLKLKIKSKLKKGKYTLYITGRNANGKAAEGALTVRVR